MCAEQLFRETGAISVLCSGCGAWGIVLCNCGQHAVFVRERQRSKQAPSCHFMTHLLTLEGLGQTSTSLKAMLIILRTLVCVEGRAVSTEGEKRRLGQAAGDLPHYMTHLGKGFPFPGLLHGHQQVRLSPPGPFPPTREGRRTKVWASPSSSHSTPVSDPSCRTGREEPLHQACPRAAWTSSRQNGTKNEKSYF